jgi:hypothetical protein
LKKGKKKKNSFFQKGMEVILAAVACFVIAVRLVWWGSVLYILLKKGLPRNWQEWVGIGLTLLYAGIAWLGLECFATKEVLGVNVFDDRWGLKYMIGYVGSFLLAGAWYAYFVPRAPDVTI